MLTSSLTSKVPLPASRATASPVLTIPASPHKRQAYRGREQTSNPTVGRQVRGPEPTRRLDTIPPGIYRLSGIPKRNVIPNKLEVRVRFTSVKKGWKGKTGIPSPHEVHLVPTFHNDLDSLLSREGRRQMRKERGVTLSHTPVYGENALDQIR